MKMKEVYSLQPDSASQNDVGSQPTHQKEINKKKSDVQGSKGEICGHWGYGLKPGQATVRWRCVDMKCTDGDGAIRRWAQWTVKVKDELRLLL